jgi:hypothetical protein
LGVAPSGFAARDPTLARALAAVRKQCPPRYAEISTTEWMSGWRFNVLYGNCLAGDGRDQHVWFFAGSRLIGMDTKEPDSSKDIIGLWRDSDTFAFMYVLYRRNDANCCPTAGGAVVRFRLADGRVVALEKLPPQQLGSAPLGR